MEPQNTGFLEESPGNRSMMRAMCFIALLAGIGWVFMARSGGVLNQYDVAVFFLFMVAAFAPKAVQKYAEQSGKVGG